MDNFKIPIEKFEIDCRTAIAGAGIGMLISGLRNLNPINATFCGAFIFAITPLAMEKFKQLAASYKLEEKIERKYLHLAIDTATLTTASLALFALGVFNVQLVTLSIACALLKIGLNLYQQKPEGSPPPVEEAG